jgi:P22_AR N-terminal domain
MVDNTDNTKKTKPQFLAEPPMQKVEAQEIRDFIFDNDTLQLAMVGDTVYVAIRPICTYLQIDWSAQLQRIKDDEILNAEKRLVVFSPKNDDQRREMVALPLQKMHGWLFGITVKRLKNPSPELVAKIQRYRSDCFEVLWQEFVRGKVLQQEAVSASISLVPQSTQQLPFADGNAVVAMIQQLTTLSDTVPSIQKGVAALLQAADTQTIHLESLLEMSSAQEAKLQSLLEIVSSQALNLDQAVELLSQYLQNQGELEEKIERVDERTKRLSPAHALEIQNAVGHIVKAIRKKNPSITEQIARQMVYGRLKNRFRPATSYREIDDDRFKEAMDYLRQEYQSVLQDNPQQTRLF